MNCSVSRVVLVGFMASGKTTIGRFLAARLNATFVDLDAEIALRARRSVSMIIDDDGEPVFRRLETAALCDALASHCARPLVLAAGGGAWTLEENRCIISEHNGSTIWLDAPFDLCWQRILAHSDARPLARSKQQARILYEQRRELYRLATHRIAITSALDADEIAEQIIKELIRTSPPLQQGSTNDDEQEH